MAASKDITPSQRPGVELSKLNFLRSLEVRADREGRLPDELADAIDAVAVVGGRKFSVSDSDPVAFSEVAERLAVCGPTIAYAWLLPRQVEWILSRCGTEAQKQKWLSRISGDSLFPAALYMYEGNGGAPSECQTRIEVSATQASITGLKTPAFFAESGELAIVVGKDANGQLIAAIVDRFDERIEFRQPRGGMIGFEAIPTATSAEFRQLVVPRENIISSENLLRELTVCRLAHAAVCLGVAKAATDYAAEWARNRNAFGRPTLAFQGVSFPLANLVLEADAVRMGIHEVLRSKSEAAEIERRSGYIIAHANQLISDATRDGIQMMGVHGVSAEYPQEARYRCAGIIGGLDFDPLTNDLFLR